MKTPIQTVSLKDARREYLEKFIEARWYWKVAQAEGVQSDVNYLWNEMRKWAALIDITTRLQNELRGRKK